MTSECERASIVYVILQFEIGYAPRSTCVKRKKLIALSYYGIRAIKKAVWDCRWG